MESSGLPVGAEVRSWWLREGLQTEGEEGEVSLNEDVPSYSSSHHERCPPRRLDGVALILSSQKLGFSADS